MKVIATEKAPGAIGPYSQGFLTNGFVYTSGQIPVNPADGTIPEGIAAQAEQSCKNVGAILEAGGSGFDKVVKTTCFLADIAEFAAFNEVSPSRTCPRAACARSSPSQRRDPPSVPGSGCCMKPQKSQNCAAVWQTSSGFCYFMIGPDALP